MIGITLAERRWLPDSLIRCGIRRLLHRRLNDLQLQYQHPDATANMVAMLRESPLAVETAAANKQHYEVPAQFYQRVLGPRMKYSACLFHSAESPLADAEEAMLQLTCDRASMQDGMNVLELGCGWGSLSLWLAEHYPNSRITAVSNSTSQKQFIDQQAAVAGLSNLNVITADMRDFQTSHQYDRIVSVEMFEHMRNYERLLHQAAQWLRSDGQMFVHI
ncbi:MAG: class I SAM-dependent methyltransferase, partial [Planctomycetales bacterium]|nr:class I SAM-dependent methyltransferase [Planctomycetales bacterium]